MSFEKAIEELGKNLNLRPGQTVISKSKVMKIVNEYDSTKAQSSIYVKENIRYIVEGHHTTVATKMLGKGTGMNMNTKTFDVPSAMNVYWTKKWYEFWKTKIKILD
jgi:hypothetical protein